MPGHVDVSRTMDICMGLKGKKFLLFIQAFRKLHGIAGVDALRRAYSGRGIPWPI